MNKLFLKGPNQSDARKRYSPAYTFGGRPKERVRDLTPGPGDYNIHGVTHNGPDWSQVAFMSPRLNDPVPFVTPSPNRYHPERSIYYFKDQAPAYTFGFKVNIR